MPVLEVPQTLPERIAYLLHPVVELETAHGPLSDVNAAVWQEWFEQLSAWARDPQQLSDEEVEAPNGRMIELAIDVAAVMRDWNVDAPDRMIPNGDGGIVFRWRSRDFTWSLELEADGSMETSLMEDDKLVSVPVSRPPNAQTVPEQSTIQKSRLKVIEQHEVSEHGTYKMQKALVWIRPLVNSCCRPGGHLPSGACKRGDSGQSHTGQV